MANKKTDIMISIYGNHIIEGKKTIMEVPGIIREGVSQWLIDNGQPELAEENV
ncbi:MAG: hypothetical protein K2N51_15105 [Lachnospiraceae bacterium]|nr:hypothetical protein [Lachnospiraceae bacterium]